ncbi:hypothetical protein MWU76_11450 [Gelidibacter sp. F2691]|nr:hypothetical protein [Gelidibacter sp. F2691]
MNKFLIKVLLFFGTLAVVGIIVDHWVSKTLAQSESYAMGDAKVWHDILQGHIDDELLIYGSSRAWRHFDPEFIEKHTGLPAHNFGVDGLSFDIQHLRHELNLKYNRTPKIIIYSVDVNTLNSPSGLYNDEQFLPFFYSDTLFHFYTKKYENFTLADYRVPMLRYSGRKKPLTYFIKEVINWSQYKRRTYKGFGTVDRKWNTDFNKAIKKQSQYYKDINTDMVERFDAFLIDSNTKGISVVLMYSPEHVLGQELIENRAEIVRVFDSLAIKNKIPFFDYSEASMNRSKDYFYNSSHLNAKGVQKFNELYINDLKQFINLQIHK